MNFMKKIPKISKKLDKSAKKTFATVKDKSEEIIKDAEIKEKVTTLSKNVGDFAGKTYDAAKDKSSDIIERTKIKITINDNVVEIDNVYEKMGLALYEKYKRGEKMDPVFAKECKKIDKINKQIAKGETKIQDLKNK